MGTKGEPVEIEIEAVGDGPRMGIWQRLSWAHTLGLVIGLGIFVWLALWIIPNAQLESAKQQVIWCTSSDRTTRFEPEQCLVGQLTLARVSPLTRGRANSIRARAVYEAHRRALTNALDHGTITAAERDAAAEELVALGQLALEREASLERPTFASYEELELLEELVALGALSVASDAAFAEIEAGRPVTLWAVERALLTRGDFERIGELAGSASDNRTTQRGAWLCLRGDREAGAALLAEAEAEAQAQDAIWGRLSNREHLIRTVCLGESVALDAVTQSQRSWAASREAARDPAGLTWTEASIASNLGVLAQLIIRDEPGPMALLEGIGVDEWGRMPPYTVPDLTTYYVLTQGDPLAKHPRRHFPVYGPETLLRAAELTGARVAEAEALEPFAAAEPEPQVFGVPESEPEPLTPADRLELLTATLAIEAGREFTRRGQLERARAALALADAHPPVEGRAPLAWMRLRARDFEAVVAFAGGLRAAIASDAGGHDWREVSELGLLEVEALAARGHLVQARAVLDELSVSFGEWPSALLDARAEVIPELSSLRTQARTPTIFLRDEDIAAMTKDVRRHDAGALILDTQPIGDLGLREYLWRRAELARRLGDAEELEYWQTRAIEILALAKTEDDQLLLDYLGI